MRLILLVIAHSVACGGATAEAPLSVRLGLDHEATRQALAAQTGDAWVVARYEGDRLIELRRLERYADDNRAVERWNELIEARAKTAAPDDSALAVLKERNLVEPGTRSMKAFRDGEAVVGVFLVTPSPPDRANVVEKISFAK